MADAVGTIPGNLASLPNLNLLDLSNNQFSGTLDDYSNQMSNSQAGTVYRYFNASYNQIIGTMWKVIAPTKAGILTVMNIDMKSSTLAETFPQENQPCKELDTWTSEKE